MSNRDALKYRKCLLVYGDTLYLRASTLQSNPFVLFFIARCLARYRGRLWRERMTVEAV